MMRKLLGAVLAMAICGHAAAQAPASDIDRWKRAVESSQSKDEKLALLKLAFDNFTQSSLPDWKKEEWRKAWLYEYGQEAKKSELERIMPNPYSH
jgi:hypothetical protein